MAINASNALVNLENYKPQYLGLAELALVLEISKANASNMRSRGKLPEPCAELALGPVWYKPNVRGWLKVLP